MSEKEQEKIDKARAEVRKAKVIKSGSDYDYFKGKKPEEINALDNYEAGLDELERDAMGVPFSKFTAYLNKKKKEE